MADRVGRRQLSAQRRVAVIARSPTQNPARKIGFCLAVIADCPSRFSNSTVEFGWNKTSANYQTI